MLVLLSRFTVVSHKAKEEVSHNSHSTNARTNLAKLKNAITDESYTILLHIIIGLGR